MRSIKELKNLKGKRVLVRVDFNVPVQNGRAEDDYRIKKTLPTINFLLKKGAKPVLVTHLGSDGSASLEPVKECFFKISKIPKDKVEFFDNVRKFPGETGNDVKFAKHLAMLADIYVNDAFPVSHRMHASIVGVPKYLPHYAGLQLVEEVKNLSKVSKHPKHPFLFILGGAKFSTKMPLIKKYLKLADYVFIGGALLNDFLKAKGYEVGKSLVDGESAGIHAMLKNKKLILPTDVLVQSGKKLINKKTSEVKKDEMILDIGKNSIKMIDPYIKRAKMILWNGPLGKYEIGGAGATKAILKKVLGSKNEVVIGGGDIVTVLSKLKTDRSKEKAHLFVSTGGGATLDFLASGTLPGIKALQ